MIVIHRQTAQKTRKTGPTPFLWGIIILCLILAVAAVGIASAQNAKNKALLLAEQPINDAVEYALTVARQTATALGTDEDVKHVRETAENILSDKEPLSRAERTQDLVGELLSLAQGNQAATDELNGAKNRVHIAVRNYKNTESGGR